MIRDDTASECKSLEMNGINGGQDGRLTRWAYSWLRCLPFSEKRPAVIVAFSTTDR